MLNLNQKIENFCINNKCSKCGECCTDMIPLTIKEVYKIQKYIDEHGIKQNRWWNGKDLHHSCPFLNETTKMCDIYPVRPFVCRDFICCRSQKTLITKRQMYNDRADYNTIKGRVISLHRLFYGDDARELNFWYGLMKDFKGDVSLTKFLEIMHVEPGLEKYLIKKGEPQ